MKLLYATSLIFPSIRANRVQTLSQARAFHALLGDRFVLGVATRGGEPFDVPYVETGEHLTSAPRALAYLRYAKGNDVTHIYCREEKLLFFLLLLAPFMGRFTFCYEIHHLNYVKTWWHKYILARVPYAVPITEGTKQEILRAGYRGNILVAADAVDIRLFDLPQTREEAREKTGLPTDRTIAMYVGSIDEPWKGAGTFYESSKLLPDVLFVIVGGKPHYVTEFEESHPPRENVLMTGHKDYATEFPLYARAADVLVIPNSAMHETSRVATSPLKLFAYMASGTPIVATDIQSIREVLSDELACLVPADDAPALADGIERTLSDRAGSAARARAARSAVEAYTWDKRAERILSFLGVCTD